MMQPNPSDPKSPNLIEFTQYMLPNGRKVQVFYDGPNPETVRLAKEIIAAGHHRFECEVLTTGHISVTCFDIENEDDIAIEICSNGPPIESAIDNMVAAAHRLIFHPPKSGE